MVPSGHRHDSRFDSALGEIRQTVRQGSPDVQAVVDILAGRLAHYSWVGIYLVIGDELVLGPWQGPQATEHVRIPIGEGICGSAAASGTTEIVADVSSDERYLACFASTRSEIVVPILRGGVVIGEIDIDSDQPSAFGETDQVFLEHVATLLAPVLDTARDVATRS